MSESMPSLREKSFNISTRSLKDPPEVTQAVAYVPYLHARNTLSRVIDDMKNMKMSHLSIVAQIEEQYQGIENDSRDQFNAFVISLQDEQKNRINTFRQTIEAHNVEIKERNNYWNETLQSLSKRNKDLLRQKRGLLLAYKADMQKWEDERNALQAKLLEQISEQDSKLKQLEGQLESKDKIVEAVPVAAAVVAAERRESVSSEEKLTDPNLLVASAAVGDGAVWKERYEKEREDHHEHSRRLERDLQQVKALLASSGASTLQERGVYEEKVKELAKEIAALKIKYETTATFLQNVMASVDSEEQYLAAKKKIDDDRTIMLEEQSRLQSEINEWQEKWKKDQGALPDENQKPDAAKELDTQLSEVQLMLSNLDKQEEALNMLKEGRTPQAKFEASEPVVTTIEVQDPMLVKELESSKSLVLALEDKLRMAEGDAIKISDLENENVDLRGRLADYEKQMESMRRDPALAATLALGAAATHDRSETEDELEEARKEVEDLKQQLEAAKIGIVPDAGDEDISDLMKRIEDYQNQVDHLEGDLMTEREKCNDLQTSCDMIQSDLDKAKEDLVKNEKDIDAKVIAATAVMAASIKDKDREIEDCNMRIEELEKARLANLDVDAKAEIEKAKKEAKTAKLSATKAKKDKDDLEMLIVTKDQKVKSLEEKLSDQANMEADLKRNLDSMEKEKQKLIKECEAKFAAKEKKRKAEEDEKVKVFENKIRKLEAAAAVGVAGAARKSGGHAVVDPNTDKKIQRMEAQIAEMKRLKLEDQNRIKELDRELKEAKLSAKGAAADKDKKLADKKMKDLEKKLEIETKKFEREQKRANDLSEELDQLKKDYASVQKEYNSLKTECEQLKVAAATGAEMAAKVASLEAENKQLIAENKTLTDNYNTERVLRKKYYNMVEDMKGKIRVYCRYRPMSKTETANKNKPVVKAPDEYTVQVESRGNLKEFQFDQVFTSDSTQEQIFEDTFNLVQSAVDGYNVCIFAYGQTGSGKTYTMIGDSGQTQPGIAPRAFERIFHLIEENKGKMSFEVSCYMLELYNENLVDLLTQKGAAAAKLDIKKDKKGMVFIQGATVQKASTSQELYKIFEKGSESRHVASTKMNAESSRSHLVIGIILESVNLTTGAVTRGKLSLVDLAGSERVGKTGATAQQLKEANSINKSLSALGDVISALSSEQSFIPYRNNKLTMLMQDSLGGNAKTLMFVNISPADYNADETAISLTYASRVKLITNDASKNADSKEVARLRSIVAKLKAGESIEEDD